MEPYCFSMHSAPFGPPNLAAEMEEQCSQGHRASLQLRTSGGGSICLLCFSNLFTHSASALTVHRAYAVSQISRALEDAFFRNALFESHRHFLVSPLSLAVCSASDQTLANDITNVITKLCTTAVTNSTVDDNGGNVLVQDFIHHLLQHLASSALTWTPTLTYALHCLGLLLELHCNSCNAVPCSLRNQKVFMSNLVSGLHLPGDEIRGEILFVLYKLLNLEDGLKELLPFCPHLRHLATEVLLKTESDELRTNCLGLSTISLLFSLGSFMKRDSGGDEQHTDFLCDTLRMNISTNKSLSILPKSLGIYFPLIHVIPMGQSKAAVEHWWVVSLH